MHMKAFREQIINFIYKVVTGTKRMRLLLTPAICLYFFLHRIAVDIYLFLSGPFFWIARIYFKTFQHSCFPALFDYRCPLMVVVRGEIL